MSRRLEACDCTKGRIAPRLCYAQTMRRLPTFAIAALSLAFACGRGDSAAPGGGQVARPGLSETQPSSDGALSPEDREADADSNATAADRDPVMHMFLLLGQSNMAGYALASDSDSVTDDRIQMLGFDSRCGRIANEWALAKPSLHDFINGCSAKVSPGDWFAKALVERIPEGDTIGLVPAAFSGKPIEAFLEGGEHYETIVEKIGKASAAPSARFAGILFHQGESNSGETSWPGKVKTLYEQMKSAMGIEEDIPFLAGELPYSGDAAGHNTQVAKVPDQGDHFFVVSAEGLTVDPADVKWNLHFGHDDTVELGRRYAATMAEALKW